MFKGGYVNRHERDEPEVEIGMTHVTKGPRALAERYSSTRIFILGSFALIGLGDLLWRIVEGGLRF